MNSDIRKGHRNLATSNSYLATLEVCVDTIEGVLAARKGGAVRVELCSALSEGGLTPSAGLMTAAVETGIPCYAMIRPRSGLFHFTAAEERIMLADIEMARSLGLAGVVLGAQNEDGALNVAMLTRLRSAAAGLGATLHRVIDVVPDPLAALDQVIDLGFDRILTSGTQPEAPEGKDMIREMVNRADDQISIMPGCGLLPENIRDLVNETGVSEVHAACSVPVPDAESFSDFDPSSGRWRTSETEVARMVQALQANA